MSSFSTYQTGEESPPSSDDKMDTSSDTLHSQDTPYSDSDDPDHRNPQVLRLTAPQDINSTLSSDSDDLENPTQNSELRNGTNYEPQEPNPVLRLSEPSVQQLTTKMSTLYLDSPDRVTVPEKIQNTSTPKLSSTLTLTTSHPLMGLASPVYPDLIPKKVHKSEDDKDQPLSSVEDEKNYSLYSPERNTSKNNLYFTDNFVTAESILTDNVELPPDVARFKVKRKIVSKIDTPQRNLSRNVEGSKTDCAMKDSSQSTPECLLDETEYHSGVAEWADPPSQLRNNPNFELPIEMSSSIGIHNDLDSPDVVSSSTLEEKSLYAAMLDPSTGGVLLRHTPRSVQPPRDTRRKIQLPVEEDRSSLDSLSDATLESEDEPIDIENRTCDNNCEQCSDDDDDSKHSKSTNTVSHSDTIPEYSAAEELTADRAWLTVGAENRRLCDMKVIEPYKRVVSHGGYSGGLALVVFSACYLPDNSRADYHYVMDNLFLYVIYTLERLVTDEYILIYLHGSPRRRRLPTLHWLHECYKLIDRRLRKSLKHLYVVHPTIWLRSFVILTKPFISSKFFRKLSYVKTLDQLMNIVPVEPNAIPELVKEFDSKLKR